MKKIEWLAPTKEVLEFIPKPKPAKNFMPDWYKSMPKYANNKMSMESIKGIGENDKRPNLTAKSCMPFMDTFLTGYIQETWCEIYIKIKDDQLEYEWAMNPQIMSNRDKLSSDDLNLNDDFYHAEFEWRQYWVPKLPKGYSMIYTHPFNRTDLPFYSFTGIIDNDRFFTRQAGGAHPFFIKKGFEGIIPIGTPMYQMIPIKREYWKSDKGYLDKYESKFWSPRRFFQDGYKNLYWQKKDYQ